MQHRNAGIIREPGLQRIPTTFWASREKTFKGVFRFHVLCGWWFPGVANAKRVVAFGALLLTIWGFNSALPAGTIDWPEVWRDSFDSADRWEPTDPEAWEIAKTSQGGVYRLVRQSAYQPPYRSPHNISRLRNIVVSDFVLDVDVRSTTRDYGHRDICLFFGYQDASHFYYVHLGKRTDDHANQIFIVNEAPRTKISTRTTAGTPWDDDWHHVRIVRRTGEGTIEVYFDNMEKPVMTATDRTFVWGQVGLGSFDDTGDFDNFVLRGHLVERQTSKP